MHEDNLFYVLRIYISSLSSLSSVTWDFLCDCCERIDRWRQVWIILCLFDLESCPIKLPIDQRKLRLLRSDVSLTVGGLFCAFGLNRRAVVPGGLVDPGSSERFVRRWLVAGEGDRVCLWCQACVTRHFHQRLCQPYSLFPHTHPTTPSPSLPTQQTTAATAAAEKASSWFAWSSRPFQPKPL